MGADPDAPVFEVGGAEVVHVADHVLGECEGVGVPLDGDDDVVCDGDGVLPGGVEVVVSGVEDDDVEAAS
mgnify:FL=1